MGQALYRKYRSRSLSEIIGQEHITMALQQAIDSDRLSHAYLFTGPRGTGKTSIARILAQQINGLEYSSDPQLDIIEIDAASNRRIDEIRDLRDKVYIAPTSLNFKVYIIDEVHMLTREAFNALLKTLEEPPAHVVFILATTDVHKLPETIISRTQRYSFRPVEAGKVIAHLKHIAEQEKIIIDDEALALIAEHGQGSFRDSISMLDQIGNQSGAITANMVRQQLGVPALSAVDEIITSLAAGSIVAPVTAVAGLYDQGFRATGIAEQLGRRLRTQLTDGTLPIAASAALELLKQLLNVPAAHNAERFLELTLMQAVPFTDTVPAPAAQIKAAAPSVETPKATPVLQAPKPAKVAPKPQPVAEKPEEAPGEPVAAPEKPVAAKPISGQALDEATWPEVLGELKKQYNTIYGIVRMAQPDFSQPGKVTLGFTFAFHQKRISDPKNRKILADTIEQVTGQQLEIACINTKVQPDAKPLVAAPADALKDISNIFGGGEII